MRLPDEIKTECIKRAEAFVKRHTVAQESGTVNIYTLGGRQWGRNLKERRKNGRWNYLDDKAKNDLSDLKSSADYHKA